MAPSAPEPTARRSTGADRGPRSPATVTVRYWAAARAAAGDRQRDADGRHAWARSSTRRSPRTPSSRGSRAVASFLLDGRAVGREEPVPDGGTVEVLPPFAGG